MSSWQNSLFTRFMDNNNCTINRQYLPVRGETSRVCVSVAEQCECWIYRVAHTNNHHPSVQFLWVASVLKYNAHSMCHELSQKPTICNATDICCQKAISADFSRTKQQQQQEHMARWVNYIRMYECFCVCMSFIMFAAKKQTTRLSSIRRTHRIFAACMREETH